MTRSIFFTLSALLTMLALSSGPVTAQTWRDHDRNNEPACAQPGNVDPRCYVAQRQDPADQQLNTDDEDDEDD
jgi:hypothetical protein